MEVPDINPLSASEKPRKYSIGKIYIPDPDEIEKITVKPSTELIPDEYQHEDNKKGLVLIFYSKRDEENKSLLREALIDQDYNIPDSNLYPITTKELVLNNLREVATRDHEDKTCFILIFMGIAEEGMEDRFLVEDETNTNNYIKIREVWSHFTSDKCPTLRYKPKIFIFQASQKLRPTQFDSYRSLNKNPPHGAYDIPAEADILLVYKKIEDPMSIKNHFIEQLCNSIDDDGHKDDVIGIVTHTDHEGEKRPLIISTLTRKFYVRASNQRGHHLSLHYNHDKVFEILQDLNAKINTIHDQQIAFKRTFEQRVGRKLPEASTSATHSEDFPIRKRDSPKMQVSDAKKISRPASSASSVDSKSKKDIGKKPWKY